MTTIIGAVFLLTDSENYAEDIPTARLEPGLVATALTQLRFGADVLAVMRGGGVYAIAVLVRRGSTD